MPSKLYLPTVLYRIGFAISSFLIAGLQPAISREITWRVENNFRIFSNASDQEFIKNIALQSQFPGSASFSINDIARQWEKVPSTPYNSKLGTYDKEYVDPTKWQIRLSFNSAPFGSLCEWRVGEFQYVNACHDFVPKDPIGKGPTNVEVSGPQGLTGSAKIVIRDVLFAALGDSWISGEGTPDVFQNGQKRQRQWWDEKCHRSLYAWPILTAARYAVDHAQQSVTLVSRACSGAILSDLLNIPGISSTSQNQKPQFRSRRGLNKKVRVAGSVELKPQIAQLSKDLCLDSWQDLEGEHGEGVCKGKQRMPDYIFLSIGGNDAKFAPLVINALALKINEGIELKDGSKRQETLVEKILRPLLVLAKSEIEDYKNEATKTVEYLETYYPQMGERLSQSFQGVPVLMTLYPDPLHGEPTTFCGRAGKKLWIRDDGIRTVDFTMHGFEDALANLLKRRISNEEVVAIHDDFYLRFVGREGGNDEYRGLLSIGRFMEKRYPGQWSLVQTTRFYPKGESPRDYKSAKDVDQLPGYYIRGYCVSGNTNTGRWFNTVSDSIDRQGDMGGAMHPNIFGQLYYTSKVYKQIIQPKRAKILSGLEKGHDCPSAIDLVKLTKRKEDAEAAYGNLEKLYPAMEAASYRFELSTRVQSGAGRHTQFVEASDRSNWGTFQWSRQAALEFPEIAAYNEALGEWRKKMALYEDAYIQKMESDQSDGKMYGECK